MLATKVLLNLCITLSFPTNLLKSYGLSKPPTKSKYFKMSNRQQWQEMVELRQLFKMLKNRKILAVRIVTRSPRRGLYFYLAIVSMLYLEIINISRSLMVTIHNYGFLRDLQFIIKVNLIQLPHIIFIVLSCERVLFCQMNSPDGICCVQILYIFSTTLTTLQFGLFLEEMSF